jgi:hypothetical protein
MCLEVPFNGRDMRQLCANIVNGVGGRIDPSSPYSTPLKDLVRSMLMRDYHHRPSINYVLKLSLLKGYI